MEVDDVYLPIPYQKLQRVRARLSELAAGDLASNLAEWEALRWSEAY
jgi:hypothetical protein